MDSILTRITVEIRYANRSRLSRDWSGEKTLCPDAKIYHLLSGSAHVTFGGVTRTLLPGDVYCIPPNVLLDYGLDDHMDILWTHASARVMGVVDLFDYAPMAFNVRDERGVVRSMMERLVWLWHSATDADQIEAQGIVLQLLAPFMRSASEDGQSQRRGTLLRFEPVFRYIEEHADQPIRVETLAGVARLETSHFATLFAKAVGVPPAKYLLRRRIEQAQVLLRTTDLNVGEIAARLAFADAFHFSRAFKRFAGVAPSAYRDSVRADAGP